MHAYKIETAVNRNHSLKLDKLPFEEGDRVEVIILKNPQPVKEKHKLKGKVIKYLEPFESVALSDWNILQ